MERRDILLKRFFSLLLEYARTKTDLHVGISPPSACNWISKCSEIPGVGYNYRVTQKAAAVELYIGGGSGSKEEYERIFDYLHNREDQIERSFGSALGWHRLDAKEACRITAVVEGGYRDNETQWQTTIEEMVETMIRLERALRPHISEIRAEGYSHR